MTRPLPIIVLPLRFERRVLERAVPPMDLHCCGPGAAAITAWAVAGGRTDRPVVLAGLAGGLSARATAGNAFAVDQVVDGEGNTWRPPLAERLGARPPDVTVISTVRPVMTSASKCALAEKHRADLVDLESIAFARAATKLGWTWGIVRGVSDGPADELPAGTPDWVDAHGKTRSIRVAAGLARHPASIRRLMALRRHSILAMRAVAARVAGL